MKLFAALATLLLSVPTMAYEAGTFIVRGSVATVSPDVSSSSLSLGGAELPGTAADVDDASALGLTGTYMLSDHFGVEVVAASPFSHGLEVSGLGDTISLGETSQLPPTVLLQWYPMQPSTSVQPYLGLGVNYTVFFDEEVSGAANRLFGTLGATGNADLSLENSFGLAAEAGVDMAFGADRRWLLNLAVLWVDLDTEAKVSVPGLGNVSADVDVDPLVTMVGLGYRF
ncbi:OmpW family protein [Microbulbifer sp. TYP-18]|uniref:OmpW family protein n=1 Tax=Microbulbifer sp. TYP-18 TaxID=3230024 RepID=UPI0034C5B63D